MCVPRSTLDCLVFHISKCGYISHLVESLQCKLLNSALLSAFGFCSANSLGKTPIPRLTLTPSWSDHSPINSDDNLLHMGYPLAYIHSHVAHS